MAIAIYTGPSMIDGAPIVVLATLDSRNVKTGALIQTFIMRSDIEPHLAVKTGQDSSVCGNCPRRIFNGGDCYVLPHQAALSSWRAWEREGKPAADTLKACLAMEKAAKGHGLRMGSYGDPAAVPFYVWQILIDSLCPKTVTGYTHQWGNDFAHLAYPEQHKAWMRDNLMASCDNTSEAELARVQGWRFFLAVPKNVEIPARTVECLSDKMDKTCEECGICNGNQGRLGRASVYIREHGAKSMGKARRSAALAVMA